MIVVFGSINVDLVARVARLPRPGETISGTSLSTLAGGKGANQALAARRAGATVAMAGAVGADGLAAAALAGLIAAGVDVRGVRHTAEPTGIALIHVDAAGQNAITIVAGANAAVDTEAIADESLGPATILILQLEVPLEAVCAMALRARQRGARVILNAAPARALPEALLADIDVLIVNVNEAVTIGKVLSMPPTPEDFSTAVHRRYGCGVIVTLGSRGVIAAVDDGVLSVDAPVVQVVDTTGAGDAFVGVFAAALDRGADWRTAIAEGVAAGSLACAAPGAQAALPERAAIALLAASVASAMRARSLRPAPAR